MGQYFYSLLIFTLSSYSQAAVRTEMAEDLDSFINEYEDSQDFVPLKNEELSVLQTLDYIHDGLSEEITENAERIDSFFVNERVIDGRNQTNLRLLNTASVIEHQGFKNNADVRLRLRLPQLQEKVQFELGQQVDEYSAQGGNTGSLQNSPLRSQDRATRAGFSFFKDVLSLKSKFTAGARYRNGFVPYGNFRLSRDIAFNRRTKLTLINDFFGDTDDRTGDRFTAYLDYSVNKKLLFRLINEAIYRDLDHTFLTTNGFAFFHELSKRRSMSYLATVNGLNPTTASTFHANSYQAYVTYRQLVYKNYMFFEYSPGVSFPRDRQFDTQLEFYFRIEIIFGKV